jgi:hypothetical protein
VRRNRLDKANGGLPVKSVSRTAGCFFLFFIVNEEAQSVRAATYAEFEILQRINSAYFDLRNLRAGEVIITEDGHRALLSLCGDLP